MTSRIPLNDPSRLDVHIVQEIRQAVDDVMLSGYFIQGNQHDCFLNEFAAWCGVGHAAGVGNGTDALELCIRALPGASGDFVVTAANAGGYAATAAVAAGCRPLYVDVTENLTMCPVDLRTRLAGAEHIRCVVVTHLYGQLAEIEQIAETCREFGIAIVEDCAQSHGALFKDRRAGSFGALAAFSFYPTKNLGAVGDAGAVVSDSAELIGRVRSLAQYGWSERYNTDLPGGRNSRLDELQAAVLRVKLRYLDEWNATRRAIAAQYREAARSSLRFPTTHSKSEYVAHLCVAMHHDRDAARAKLDAAGISTSIHYAHLDYQQRGLAAYRPDFPLRNSETLNLQILTLPCFPGMTDEETGRVCEALQKL